jgi:hypothetical protein
MVTNRFTSQSCLDRGTNPLSKAETVANKLLARAIVDDICTNVVDHPDTWRQRAIEEIALHLDVAASARVRP